MSFLVRFTPTSLTQAKYDQTIRRLEEGDGAFPPDGLEFHVCFGSDGDLRVSEIWDSRAQFEAFGERLIPILAEAGIEFFRTTRGTDGSQHHQALTTLVAFRGEGGWRGSALFPPATHLQLLAPPRPWVGNRGVEGSQAVISPRSY